MTSKEELQGFIERALEVPWRGATVAGTQIPKCPFCLALVVGLADQESHVAWHVETDPDYFQGETFGWDAAKLSPIEGRGTCG